MLNLQRAWEKIDFRLRLLIIGAVLLLLPLLLPNAYWIRITGMVGLYVVLVLGLNVICGLAGLLDLGYVAFYGIGGYTYALLASPQFDLHYSFWLVLPLSIGVAGLAGVALGYPVLRLRGDYLAIVTMGFGEIVRLLLLNLDEPINITNGPNGIVGVDPPRLFGFTFTTVTHFYYLILVFVAVAVFIVLRLESSRIGRAWMAIREDETAAKSMGVNTHAYKLLAFATGAMLGGSGGILLATWQGAIFPASFTMNELVTIFCMMVLGGTGSVTGVVAGSAILVVLPELLRGFDIYRMLIYGFMLVLMMRFRPSGIVAARATSLFSAATRAISEEELAGEESLSDVDISSLSAVKAMRRGFEVDAGWPESDSACLEVRSVTKRFGGLTAVNGVSFSVRRGEIVSIIGPNGAGKTTLFNLITGIYKPDSGRIFFYGKDITGLPPFKMAEIGISRTFQTIRLFPNMSILENVMVGGHTRLRAGAVSSVLRLPGVKREENRLKEVSGKVLSFFSRELANRSGELVKNLPYAHQRRVEIARALASNPRLLLFDEPAAGMNPTESAQLVELIRRVRDQGYTIILVEHQMAVVMNISDKIIVLDHGEKIAEGTPQDILEDPRLVEAYVGAKATEARPARVRISEPAPDVERGLREGVAGPVGPIEAMPERPLLRLTDVYAGYGAIRALHGLGLEVRSGEIVCLLGANGAGKTTTLRAIMGNIPYRRGEIEFAGERIEKLPTAAIVRLGIAVVPEGRRIFSRLTVLENLEVGAFGRTEKGTASEDVEYVLSIFPHLKDRLRQKAGTLSGGEQQMLAVGRGLMARPKLLCLDEPSMGLAPILAESLFQVIPEIRRAGTTILMVEQNARMALSIADRAYVIRTGKTVYHGKATEMLDNELIRREYLGV